MRRDTGLDILLDLHKFKYVFDNAYWYKIEVYRVDSTKERPHGIRYNLTFHDNCSVRIFGMDNAHIPKNKRKGFHGQIIEYDHTHNDENDIGTAYTFVNAEKLLTDFFTRVNAIIDNLEK
ncbi:MAG: hypothetical protein ACC657_08020 [Thiohalomonadales bacterium]